MGFEIPLGGGIGDGVGAGGGVRRLSTRRGPVFSSAAGLTTDFGAGLSTINGLDPTFGLIYQQQAVAERLIRLITTPRGSLAFYPNRCLDVREWVRSRVTPKDVQRFKALIEAEWLKDEAVDSCTVSVTYDPSQRALFFTGDVVTAAGPFQLVVGATSVTAELLSLSER